MLRRLVALVVPPACLACRAPVREGAALCRACLGALPWLPPRRCPRCALPLPCGASCPARGAAFSRSWAAVAYDGPARQLVHALKLRGITAAADAMAAQIAAGVPPGLLAEGALVPVRGHPGRTRRRGFDPAALLAAALARRSGLPVLACLERRGSAGPQAGAGRAQRRRQAGGAVRARTPVPERAVLVDDVHTTGATFDACAGALVAAGSEVVVAVSYARTLA